MINNVGKYTYKYKYYDKISCILLILWEIFGKNNAGPLAGPAGIISGDEKQIDNPANHLPMSENLGERSLTPRDM
jgi:hypothetical protein